MVRFVFQIYLTDKFLFADRDWTDLFYSQVDSYEVHSERLRTIEETLFQKHKHEILKGLKGDWEGTDHQNAFADSKIRYFLV